MRFRRPAEGYEDARRDLEQTDGFLLVAGWIAADDSSTATGGWWDN
jgi:hypothetical protein